jgi:hypothetical protein
VFLSLPLTHIVLHTCGVFRGVSLLQLTHVDLHTCGVFRGVSPLATDACRPAHLRCVSRCFSLLQLTHVDLRACGVSQCAVQCSVLCGGSLVSLRCLVAGMQVASAL